MSGQFACVLCLFVVCTVHTLASAATSSNPTSSSFLFRSSRFALLHTRNHSSRQHAPQRCEWPRAYRGSVYDLSTRTDLAASFAFGAASLGQS